jgi:hypothetical protein
MQRTAAVMPLPGLPAELLAPIEVKQVEGERPLRW